jgi:hypothetical protein
VASLAWGRLKTALVLLVAVTSAGCATTRPIRETTAFRTPRQAGLDEVLAAYDDYCESMRSFSGSGDLEVRDLRAGRSRKVHVRVVAEREGKLYLKGTVLVVTALELASDGAHFWLEIPSKKTVWTGPNDVGSQAQDDEHAPYYALRPADMSFALLPEPIRAGGGTVVALEGDPQSFSVGVLRIDGTRALVRRRIWLDRETLQLQRARLYGGGGETVAEATFANWRGGLPHDIRISRPIEGYEALFGLDKTQSNVTVPERAFAPRVPEGYAIRRVGDEP